MISFGPTSKILAFSAVACFMIASIDFVVAQDPPNVPWIRTGTQTWVVNVSTQVRGFDFRPDALHVACGNTNLKVLSGSDYNCVSCSNTDRGGASLGTINNACIPNINPLSGLNCISPDSTPPMIGVIPQIRRADQQDSDYITLTGAASWVNADKVRFKVTVTDLGDVDKNRFFPNLDPNSKYICTINDGRSFRLATLTGAVTLSGKTQKTCTCDSSVNTCASDCVYFNERALNSGVNRVNTTSDLQLGNNIVRISGHNWSSNACWNNGFNIFLGFSGFTWSSDSWGIKTSTLVSGVKYYYEPQGGTCKSTTSIRSIMCIENKENDNYMRLKNGAGVKTLYYSKDWQSYTGIDMPTKTDSGRTLYDSSVDIYFDLPTIDGKTVEWEYEYYFYAEDAANILADNNSATLLGTGNISKPVHVKISIDRTPPVLAAPDGSWQKSFADFGSGVTQSGAVVIVDPYGGNDLSGDAVATITIHPTSNGFIQASTREVKAVDSLSTSLGSEQVSILTPGYFQCPTNFAAGSHKIFREIDPGSDVPQYPTQKLIFDNVFDGNKNPIHLTQTGKLLISTDDGDIYKDYSTNQRFVSLTCQRTLSERSSGSPRCTTFTGGFDVDRYNRFCGIDCEPWYVMNNAGDCVISEKTTSCWVRPTTASAYTNFFVTIKNVLTFNKQALTPTPYTWAFWSQPYGVSAITGSLDQVFNTDFDDYFPSTNDCQIDCGPGMHIEWAWTDLKCITNIRTHCCVIGPLQTPNTNAVPSINDNIPVVECGNVPVENFIEQWDQWSWGQKAFFGELLFTGSTAVDDARLAVCGNQNINIANSDGFVCKDGYMLSGSLSNLSCSRVGTGEYAHGGTVTYSGAQTVFYSGKWVCSNPSNSTITGAGSGTANSCPWSCDVDYQKNTAGTRCVVINSRTQACSPVTLSGGYVYYNGAWSMSIAQTRSKINKPWTPDDAGVEVTAFDNSMKNTCYYALNPVTLPCGGYLPTNANPGTNHYNALWNGTTHNYSLPVYWHYSTATEDCAYKCKTGFTWDGQYCN